MSKKMRIRDHRTTFWCRDYRDVPTNVGVKYSKISCIEMSEHVGVKNFQTFLLQIRDLLEDDGIFLLQIAGLRRAFQYEDLVWGLFMAKYIFPGADASMPLNWVVGQLELAGFEVANVDNIGIHYSLTLKKWYGNWVSNKARIVEKHGERWYRYDLFGSFAIVNMCLTLQLCTGSSTSSWRGPPSSQALGQPPATSSPATRTSTPSTGGGSGCPWLCRLDGFCSQSP